MTGRVTRLVMFTDCYPYARADEWKRFELELFAERFDEVHVAARLALCDDPDPNLPVNVNILPPIFAPGQAPGGRLGLGDFASLITHPSLNDAGLAPARIKYLARSWRDLNALMASDTYRNHVAPLLPGSHLYFFWGRGYADILPLLPREQQAAALVRMHRYDLYPETNGGYMPFHSAIVRAAGRIAPVSQDGVDDLARRFPAQAHKIACLRLGTLPRPPGPHAEDGVLKLISCAHAKPVKRLHLIAEALAAAAIPVRWTHIGDGPELARLRELAAKLPANVTVELKGAMLPPEVPEHYQSTPYDLFLNVSESEGVPVAIMEAMAAGVPTLATDVGGTRELVTDATGCLIPADASPAAIWATIAAFASADPAMRLAKRHASAELVRTQYDIRANAAKVADAIASLPVTP
ncbi:glycosyltransferase [Sphingomonas sp. LB-2]|uniref:glycosyltransferase n=1 Tax=Sphingomonas caeni TaxID=2984949 RepID=UPI002230561E|nr:glycosyltransferase [Sphingomonas caeni]MCW3849354.1 glycosyltransferase [Sphingomonas caeni]